MKRSMAISRTKSLRSGSFGLRSFCRLKPHTLSASEERLLALGSSALRGHQETFSPNSPTST